MSSSFFHSVFFFSWFSSTGFSLAPLRIALSRSSRGLVGEAFSFEEIVGLDFERVRFEDGFPSCIGDESSDGGAGVEGGISGVEPGFSGVSGVEPGFSGVSGVESSFSGVS